MGLKVSGPSTFVEGVFKINDDEDPNANIPSSLVGLSIGRGAAAGVLRNSTGIFWDETLQKFVTKFTDSSGNPVAGYLGVQFGTGDFTGTVTAPLFTGDLRPASVSQRGGVQVDGTSIVATAGGVVSTVLGASGGVEADESFVYALFKRVRGTIKALTTRVTALEKKTTYFYATANFDPASTVTGSYAQSSAISILGASFGDLVEVAAPYDLQGLVAMAAVSAQGSVIITLINNTGATKDLISGTWTIRLTKKP